MCQVGTFHYFWIGNNTTFSFTSDCCGRYLRPKGTPQTLCFVIQVSLGVGAKDELHVVEAEALDYEGNQIKVTLASLKMSVQPTVRVFLV